MRFERRRGRPGDRGSVLRYRLGPDRRNARGLDGEPRLGADKRTADCTDAEMEALTSVTVAALAVIDMVKGVDRSARIRDAKITRKSGGRSGEWVRPVD